MKKFCVILFIILLVRESHALPSRYDLRELGRVTSVKHQGIPGPCWAFAALGAMESNWLTQNLGGNPDLSEMQLAYYAYRDSNKARNFTSEYNNGTLSLEGNIFLATAFLSRLSGPAYEKDFRYDTTNLESVKKFAAKKSPEDFRRPMRLRESYFMSFNENPSDSIKKELIMNHGAIVISFWHKLNKFHGDTYFNNNDKKTNHDALLIGWDDNFSRDNFKPRPSKNGAWLVKNSFGSNTGFFWLSYEQFIIGGTAFIVERDKSRLNCYYYDDLGICGKLKYSWAANIFKINTRKETLKEIGFYTMNNNTDFEIFIYSSGERFPDSPVTGELRANFSGKIKYPGYHCVNLPESINFNKNEYFAVVLKLSNKSMPVETRVKNFSDNAVINERESYFSENGINWKDGKNLNSNACIKAFTITK